MLTQKTSSSKTSELHDPLTASDRTPHEARDRIFRKLEILRDLSGLTYFEQEYISRLLAQIRVSEPFSFRQLRIFLWIWRRHTMRTPYKIHHSDGEVFEVAAETLQHAIVMFANRFPLGAIQKIELLNGYRQWQEIPKSNYMPKVADLLKEREVA